MKTISRSAFLLPVVAGGLLVAGCGASVSVGSIKIDHGKAEKMLVDGITGGTIKTKSASCPKGVEATKGNTFTCTVTWADGSEGKATVHITSDTGDIRFDASDLTEPQ